MLETMLTERRKQLRWIVGGVGVLVVGSVLWGLSGGSGETESIAKVPKELSTESLKAEASNPGKLMAKLDEARRREDLTEEQQQQVRRNAREVFGAVMAERMDEYFGASDEEEKKAVLDRHIDEFQKFRKEMEARRQDRGRDRDREERAERPERPERSEQSDAERRRRFVGQTREERKTRSESRSADGLVRRISYFRAMRSRMSERGIQMRGRGGGPGGGGPGGRGPGGGGPGFSGGGRGR